MNLSTDSKIKEKQKHKKGKGNKKSAAGGGEGTPEVSKAASLDALRQKLTQMQKLGSKYIHVYMYIRLHHHADLHNCFCTKCIYSRSIPLKKIAVFYTIFCCLNEKKYTRILPVPSHTHKVFCIYSSYSYLELWAWGKKVIDTLYEISAFTCMIYQNFNIAM